MSSTQLSATPLNRFFFVKLGILINLKGDIDGWLAEKWVAQSGRALDCPNTVLWSWVRISLHCKLLGNIHWPKV